MAAPEAPPGLGPRDPPPPKRPRGATSAPLRAPERHSEPLQKRGRRMPPGVRPLGRGALSAGPRA
eukprot:5936588-Alexandrium_andersonii.AAC.1